MAGRNPIHLSLTPTSSGCKPPSADARADVDRARARDQQLAASLSKELDNLADEVTYLAVKLRKEQQVPRSEGMDLRDRIDDVRTRARGDSTPPASAAAVVSDEIPVGTEIDVRLLDPLSSGRNQVEDRFRATTIVDLRMGDRVLIPAGSEMRGVITSLEKAGRVDRKGNMTLAFDQITVDGTRYPMHGTVTKAFEGEMKGEVGSLASARPRAPSSAGSSEARRARWPACLIGGEASPLPRQARTRSWRRARSCASGSISRRQSIASA